MDSVIVFCFLALVQLSQATSPIFKPLHDDYKVQFPIAQRSFLNPSSFFRDSAIKKSFENYSPHLNEPQLSHRRNGRNLNGGTSLETDISLNKGILTNNHEGHEFLSHQSEQDYESNIQQKLLRNKQDLKENISRHESHSLLSTNQKSKEISDSQKKSEQLNKVVSDLNINAKSSILAAKVDVDNKELSLGINAPNVQQLIKQQILSNQRESSGMKSASLTENKNQRVTSNVESIQSSMISTNTETNKHSENQQSYSSQSQKQSFTRQHQNSRSLTKNMKSNDDMNKIYQTNSSGTNDNHLLVPNLKEVFTDEQNSSEDINANQSKDTYDSEDEFWENEDTYIDDDTTELDETTKLGTQNQPTVPPINDQSSIKLSQDQPSLQPEQLNQNQPPLQPAEDQPSTELDRVDAPVKSIQNHISLILDKDTQPNQNEHTLNDSDQLLLKADLDKQYPLKQDSEQPPAQSNQDQLPLQTSQEQNHIPSQPDQNRQLLVNSHKVQPTITSNQDQPSSQPDQDILSQKPELKQSILEEYQNQQPTISQVSELQSSLKPDEDELPLRTDISQPQSVPDKSKLYSEPDRDISKNLNQFILPDLNKPSKPLTNHKHYMTVTKQSEKNNQTHISSQTSKNLKKTNSESDAIKSTQPEENQLMQDELPTQLATERSLIILSEEQQPTDDLPTIVKLDKNEPSIQTGQDEPLQQMGQAKSLPQERQDQPVVQPGQDSSILQLEQNQPLRLTRQNEPLTQSRQDHFLPQTEQDEPIIQSSYDQQLTQSISEPGQLTEVPNQSLLRLPKYEKPKLPDEILYPSQNSGYSYSMEPNQYKTHAQPNHPTEIGHDESKKHQNLPQISQENVFVRKNQHKPNADPKQDQPASNDQTNKKKHEPEIWTQAYESTYEHSQSAKQTEQSQIILSKSDQTARKDKPLTLSDENKITTLFKNDISTNKAKQDQTIPHVHKPEPNQYQGEPVKLSGKDKDLNVPAQNTPKNRLEQDKPVTKFDPHKHTTETDQANSRSTLDQTDPKTEIKQDKHLKKPIQDQYTTKLQKDIPLIIPEERRPSSKLDQDKGVTTPDQETLAINADQNKSAMKPKQDKADQHEVMIKPSKDKSKTASGHNKLTIEHKQDNSYHKKQVEYQPTSKLDQKQTSNKPEQVKPGRALLTNYLQNKPIDKSDSNQQASKCNQDFRDQNTAVIQNLEESQPNPRSEQRKPGHDPINQDKSNNDESPKSNFNQQPNTKLTSINTDSDTLQSRYTEDSDDITRSSRSRSETDSTPQRRGRYDLSRSSERQDVQQAIETEVNYKTLIVGDGSKNGKCYCSCDINSKPVFISLDRLQGWP